MSNSALNALLQEKTKTLTGLSQSMQWKSIQQSIDSREFQDYPMEDLFEAITQEDPLLVIHSKLGVALLTEFFKNDAKGTEENVFKIKPYWKGTKNKLYTHTLKRFKDKKAGGFSWPEVFLSAYFCNPQNVPPKVHVLSPDAVIYKIKEFLNDPKDKKDLSFFIKDYTHPNAIAVWLGQSIEKLWIEELSSFLKIIPKSFHKDLAQNSDLSLEIALLAERKNQVLIDIIAKTMPKVIEERINCTLNMFKENITSSLVLNKMFNNSKEEIKQNLKSKSSNLDNIFTQGINMMFEIQYKTASTMAPYMKTHQIQTFLNLCQEVQIEVHPEIKSLLESKLFSKTIKNPQFKKETPKIRL